MDIDRQQVRRKGVNNIVHRIGRALHRFIHQLRIGLCIIDIIHSKVKILRLVDLQLLLFTGDVLWGIDVCTFDVVLNRYVTNLIDLDGIAEIFDLTFVVAVEQIQINVAFVQMVQ